MFSTLLRFKGFLGRYRLPLALGGLFTLGNALFVLAQPWPLKIIVDSVLNNEPLNFPGAGVADGWSRTGLLQAAIAAYLIIAAASAACDYFGTLLMDSSGQRLVVDIRETLFSRLQRLSLRFHARQRTGDLISRVMSDIDRVQSMLVQSFSILIPNLVLLIGMLVVMLNIDWTFTLLALSVAPFLFATVFRYTSGIKSASRTARRKEGELAAKTGEVLGSIRVVQAFTREDYEDDRFSSESSQSLAANLEAIRLQAQFSPLVDVLAAIGTAVVLYVGSRRVLSGELQLGTLLVFVSYISSLYKPMRQLSKLASVTSKGVASAERISEVMELEPDVADLPGARPAPPLEGSVEFKDVEFAYADEPVLRDINLAVQQGQTIALIGPTGAGKSSLVSLIPRFFDPSKGQVLVDGEDVRNYELQSLRTQIALVLQEPLLFEGTIFDNIAYGRPDADEEEVLRAARTALVDDFVRDLPDAYETRIGERGATLSGGERQRISIARALVRRAPILILDEPTSALDPVSEKFVMGALRNLMEGTTSFVIAHRMSTILGADQVLVLDRGRIVERGTHDELLQIPDGLYRSFLDLQVGPAAPSYASTLLQGGRLPDLMIPRETESNALSSLPADDGIPALQPSRRQDLAGFLARVGLPEDHRIQVLQHHRGSRCTMRVWRDRSSFVVKAYAENPSDIADVYQLLHERGLATGSPPTASPLKGYDPSLLVIALGWLEGLGGKSLLERGGGHLAGKLAAQWLLASRDLDFDRAPAYDPATILSWGREWAELLEPQQSEISRRMRAVSDLLEARLPRPQPESLRHGSYSVSHVIDLGPGPGIVDWDSFRRGRLELDAGHYLAYLSRFAGGRTRLSEDCRRAALSFRSSLEGAVEKSDLAWFKGAALIRLTWYLCRRRPSRWAERASSLLEEARHDLTRAE